MEFLGKEIKLAILDLDGTLIDSTGIWHEIDRQFFAKRGMEIPKDYFKNICHLGLTATAHFTKTNYGIKETEEEMLQEWRDASLHQYKDVIQLKPHAKEFLEYLKNNGVKMAVATANDRELYEPCLKRLGIYAFFDYIADVNSVKEGKHSPKLYESIGNHFGIEKDNTMVLEDIVTGLKTAFENGYLTISVDDAASRSTNDEKKNYSHKYIEDLKELIEEK